MDRYQKWSAENPFKGRLVTGALIPCEGTISRHVGLKLAKYSQHSADQLPYDKSPIESETFADYCL